VVEQGKEKVNDQEAVGFSGVGGPQSWRGRPWGRQGRKGRIETGKYDSCWERKKTSEVPPAKVQKGREIAAQKSEKEIETPHYHEGEPRRGLSSKEEQRGFM